MLRAGLTFDRASVGAVLNVQPDHLGDRGIETLDDMAWIKSLVAEITAPPAGALAAIAIGHASGLRVATVAEGLRSFSSSYEDNPGRLNVYDAHPFRAVLDYGHNPAGLEAFADFVPHLARGGGTIGVITIAGDRRDEDTVEAGRVAARIFDRVIVREDADLRGREPGVVAKLIVRGLREGGLPASATQVVLPELAALRTALRAAGPGDLVVHFGDRYDEAWQAITEFEPDPRVPTTAPARDLPQRP